MADKDEFTFDEEENSGVGAEQEADDWGDYEPEKKGGSKRLLYLLLLLVILAGGAVYMFVLEPMDGPSPPVNVVQAPRKPIVAPKPVSAAKPATVPVAAPAPTQSVTTSVTPTPAPVSTVVPEVDKSAPVPVAKPVTAPAEVQPKLFEPKANPAPVVAGVYALSAGAFAMQSSVDGVMKKIRKLGYEPHTINIKRKIEMTRLLVGVYPPEVAAKKLREVKKVTDGAFILVKGAQTAVYAGSYIILDRARVFADTTLVKNGISVTEETAKVERTLQRVIFGAFANREDAAKTAQKLAGKGLETMPIKK